MCYGNRVFSIKKPFIVQCRFSYLSHFEFSINILVSTWLAFPIWKLHLGVFLWSSAVAVCRAYAYCSTFTDCSAIFKRRKRRLDCYGPIQESHLNLCPNIYSSGRKNKGKQIFSFQSKSSSRLVTSSLFHLAKR